jgi:GDP-L-fucose synthase
MNKSARIYVAGHRGLVGSALVSRLAALGFTDIITRSHAELDLTDQAGVIRFFQQEKPEYVFLAAAKVGGIHANNTYPADFIRINLEIQNNIITQSWNSGVKRLLFLGSSCIYPRECPQPIKEEYLLTGPLEPTNRPYAVAKITGIEMCWAFNRQHGTKYLAVMPTNLYGPGDNYDLQNSHVLPALIRKFHLAKLAAAGKHEEIERDEKIFGPIPADIKESLGLTLSAHQPSALNTQHSALSPQSSALSPQPSAFSPHSSLPIVVAWGTGSPRREFLYSDDMAAACIHLMDMDDNVFSSLLTSQRPPLINIGCGSDQTIRELVYLVKDVVGFDGEVVWDSTKPDGTPQKLLDVGKLLALGWQPSISLKEGIGLAYKDFIANHTND